MGCGASLLYSRKNLKVNHRMMESQVYNFAIENQKDMDFTKQSHNSLNFNSIKEMQNEIIESKDNINKVIKELGI